MNALDLCEVDKLQIYGTLDSIKMQLSEQREQRTWPVLVCGLGRCGSSLTMQMLHAGGFPVFGDWPAFEPETVGLNRQMDVLLPALAGRAAKILDPRRSKWPEGFKARVIWLDRDSREQARSQTKMMAMLGGVRLSGQDWRKVREQLLIDRELSFPIFNGLPLLRVRFEDTLKHPAKVADNISAFLQTELDRQKMIDCVIKRPSRCARGFEVEQSLISRLLEAEQPAEAEVA